jgi:hypothetical protein
VVAQWLAVPVAGAPVSPATWSAVPVAGDPVRGARPAGTPVRRSVPAGRTFPALPHPRPVTPLRVDARWRAVPLADPSMTAFVR